MTMEYFPCRVTLRSGETLDCVYVVPALPYVKIWGVWPEDDPGKLSVRIENVVDIDESPNRLPVAIADQIYRAGESCMGGCYFTLHFRDGTAQAYGAGGAVDFVSLPIGQKAQDIVRVEPHAGRNEPGLRIGLTYHWCLFDGVIGAT